MSSSDFSCARGLFGQQISNPHEVIGEYGCPNQQLEAISPLCETSFHAATPEQHRDAPFDAGAKVLTLLEVRALLVGFTLRSFFAAALRNTHDFDAFLFAGC